MLNKSTGLQDGTVYSQYMDDNGLLWLALANGVSKIEINSPVTIFDDHSGLEGHIQDITRMDDVIYVASLLGVYYMPTLKSKLLDPEIDHQNLEAYEPRFNKIPDLTTECWDLLTYKDGQKELLLIAANSGIYQIDKGKLSRIAKYDTWKMHRSKSDPSRVFLGTAAGLASINHANGKWVDEGMVDGIEDEIQNIYEDKGGNVWMYGVNAFYKMQVLAFKNNKIDEIELTTFDTTSGMPMRYTSMQPIGNKLLFASSGVYTYNALNNKFEASHVLGDNFLGEDYGIHRMSMDPTGNMWMVAHSLLDNKISIGYVTPGDDDGLGSRWIKTPFMGISNEIKHSIFHDEGGVTWLGGPEGLFRYDSKVVKDYERPYHSLIRKVRIGTDSVVFWGAHHDDKGAVALTQPAAQVPILPYDLNSVEFEFAAANFQTGSKVRFSYYLDGFDRSWSDWSEEAKKEYTNLPEMEYVFRVKAIDTYDHESIVATFAFTIEPPWHRTVWAYIMYVLSFIGFVYGAITVSTRGLQKIIKQKTADIVAQKEEIEEKNKDITDSINYAQKIQEAILPSDKEITRHLPENFVLFKPKDIVSGDFYWFSTIDGKALITAADCTGHGVPGAFMSMIGNSLLNEIVNEKGATEPADILQKLKEGVIKSLSQTGEAGTQKDGMDIAMCGFDLKNNKVEFAGAYNPLLRIRNNELAETRSDRMPIGIYADDGGKVFTNHTLELEKGDMYYIFTDGFVDQFGGPKGKKFMNKRFKALLMDIHLQPMEDQRRRLDKEIEDWKAHTEESTGGAFEQMDDILIIGVRV
ncbi:MAG: SpoIIE family protein phosphatase [Flavobacteriales bacterium]|nr:SpoIIE family protein phosphatase [Flavobacteriales bacterium]